MTDKDRFQVAKEEGKQLLKEKQYDAAIEMYLECLACADIPDKELAIIHLNIGICYFEKESVDQAIQFIDRAEQLDPSYSKSHYRKIQCLLKLKRLAEALQLCRIMLKQYPESNEFGSLLRETQTLIEIEKNSSLSYEEFMGKLTEEENNPEGIKKVFEMIVAQVDSRSLQKQILQPGGFCEELLKKAKENIIESDYCLGFLWRNVVFVRESDIKLQLSGECADVLVSLFQKRLKSISATNSQATQGVKLIVKLLQFTSILHPSLISLFESLTTYNEKVWSDFVNDLCGILQNNISNYSLDGVSNNTATNSLSEQLDKLLVQAAQMLKGISTNNNASDSQLNQDLRMLIQTLFRTLLILNPKYLDSHYFYRKEKLSRSDLLLVKELLISSYSKVSQKLIESDIHHALCVSYLRKPDNIPYIDLILQVYSLLLSDNKFTTKVADDPAFQDFNIQLQRFLANHKNEVAFIVKYGLLLFKINKQRKLPELLSFLRLFDFEALIADILMLSDKCTKMKNIKIKIFQLDFQQNDRLFCDQYSTETISEGLEFIGFMSCFDQFKVQLVESQKQFLAKLTLKVDFQLYDQGLSWLITISNLCFDQLRDFEEKQKEKFGLSDEKLEEFKQFEEKYRKEDNEQAKDIFRYNEEFIQQNNVVKYLLEEVQIIKHLAQFLKLQSAQENKNASNRSYSSNNQLKQSDLFLEYFSQLLSKLVQLSSSQDKGNSPSAILFNSSLINFAASALNQIANASLANSHLVVLHLAQYLGKTLKDANPQLFNYQEVHAIVDALFKGLRVSSHELLSFELLLSLVQMTSRGQETTSKLINSNTLTLLQNLLVEDENQYIIHATLEVLNNICLNDKMMERIGSMPTLIQLIFAHFEASFSRLLDQNPEEITNNYNEPIKILSTIYNILAINSTTEQFKVKANGHLCSSPDTLVLLLQKYAKNNGYLRMEFLYKFIFMTQSFRQKKLTLEEKSMLKAIYEDVKSQYKKEIKGDIPKNDTSSRLGGKYEAMQQNLNKYQLLKMKQLAKMQQQNPSQVINDHFRPAQENDNQGNQPAEQDVRQDQQQIQINEYRFDDEEQEEQKDNGINQNSATLINQAQQFRNLIGNSNNFGLKQASKSAHSQNNNNNNIFSLFSAQNINPEPEQQFQQEQIPEPIQHPLNWGINAHPTFQLNPMGQQSNNFNLFQNHPQGQQDQQQQQQQQQQPAPQYTEHQIGIKINPDFRLSDQQHNLQEQQPNPQPNLPSWMQRGNAAAPQQDHNSNSKVDLSQAPQFTFSSVQPFHINNIQKQQQQQQSQSNPINRSSQPLSFNPNQKSQQGGTGQFSFGNQQQQSVFRQNNSYFQQQQQQQQSQQFNIFNNNNTNTNGLQFPANQSSGQQSDGQVWYINAQPQQFQDFSMSCPLSAQSQQNDLTKDWNQTLGSFQLVSRIPDQGSNTMMEINLDYFNEEQPIQQAQIQPHQGFAFPWA